MSAIAFTTRGLRTLVDGTVRLQIDIEPKDAVAAMQLFGQPGLTGAIARLTEEAAKETLTEKKVGPLCLEAVGLSKRKDFRRFANSKQDTEGWTYQATEGGAADLIKEYCKVESRKDLDTNPAAAARFSQLKREFLEWQR